MVVKVDTTTICGTDLHTLHGGVAAVTEGRILGHEAVGVHGVPVELPMLDLWIHNVTLTMGLVDTVSIPTLLKMVASGRIPAEKVGSHTFTFGQLDEAYNVFANAAANSALKVIIRPA